MALLETLLGFVAPVAVSRGVPYIRDARWRAGPLGQPLPSLRPGRLPSPNPAVNVGTAASRRVARAHALERPARRTPRR